GCIHACHYCYARATHSYFGLNADDDFESRIFVKTNLADVLRQELAKPRWTGERVAIGTATDAYQPCEGRYGITRRALQAMLDYQNGLSIVTKSTLVLRDGDILAELSRHADVSVQFTVTTLDPETWRAVEPGTAPPWKRLDVMRRLVDRGIRCGVFIAPVLPGITDSEESLEAVVAGAKEHGASHVWASPLRLAPLVKEHYLSFIDRAYPHLSRRYERAYTGMNAPPAYQEAIQARVDRLLARHGFAEMSRGKLPQPGPGRRGPVQLGLEL
ncbi:MAG: radical SAM protein, partial [Thermomicrobiales bacterium]|nr:radical SAM protein [Thermomicrobiales bacterium]